MLLKIKRNINKIRKMKFIKKSAKNNHTLNKNNNIIKNNYWKNKKAFLLKKI